MKKFLRIALTVAVLASLASIALAARLPGGPPAPDPGLSFSSVFIAAVLSVLGL